MATQVHSRPQLRVATAGSVDDGKSTLIGRLLHDSQSVHEDQATAVARASRRYGDGEVNLALLTDGLRAEREQGITIDVAYRYFSTTNRSFVLADTPGHAEYTRNMVTGASVSDVAIVLVDVRNGVVEQTRRHVAISALLGVDHIVLAVNKMDLVDWDQGRFDQIVLEVAGVVEKLRPGVPLHAVPVSALLGDNVVTASEEALWYDGPPLLTILEQLDTAEQADLGARLGVQWVIRSHGGDPHRSYAGELSGGRLTVGDEVDVVTKGHRSTVDEIWVSGQRRDCADEGDALSIVLRDDLDVGTGDLIVVSSARVKPGLTAQESVDLCWMSSTPLVEQSRWLAVHHHGTTAVTVAEVESVLGLDVMAPVAADSLGVNDIGRARLDFDQPVALDSYQLHRPGGAMILVDPATGETVAAAMVAG